MKLIDRIIFARKNVDFSQTKLAKALGVTPQAVQNWEYGNSQPRAARLKKIAKILNVSDEWLILGKGSFKRKKEADIKSKKVTDDIMSILDQLCDEDKKHAIELLGHIAKKRQILDRYGID